MNSLDQVGPKTRPAWFRQRLAGSILIGRGRVSSPSSQSRRGSGRMRRRNSSLESYQRSAAGRGGGGGKLKAEILFRLATVIGYNFQQSFYDNSVAKQCNKNYRTKKRLICYRFMIISTSCPLPVPAVSNWRFSAFEKTPLRRRK